MHQVAEHMVQKGLFGLQDRYHVNLLSMLTWAFEFEDQPFFDGFRTLATNGVDKPVINIFRMAGLMSGERVHVESSGSVSLDNILREGVRKQRTWMVWQQHPVAKQS